MYFGTPVVLVTTLNEDGSTNVAPMSSAWWIGSSCMLGLDETSQTTLNLQRTRELVLNLPSSAMADAVDRMAGYTGTPMVPDHKAAKGYRFIDDKFAVAGLHHTPSHEVQPVRVAECPIQLEARVEDVRPFGGGSGVVAVETRVVRTHVMPELLLGESDRYIDPDRWDPLIMKFTHLYGGGRRVRGSRLAEAWAIPHNGSGRAGRAAIPWRTTGEEGVERAEVFDTAEVTCWRMSAGSSFPDHPHERDELIFLAEGELRFSDGSYARAGDVVEAPRGSVHGAKALADTVFYIAEATGGSGPPSNKGRTADNFAGRRATAVPMST
jgi:flavin reductase (DIM6/NTAB) family NADH-FMN oxidoreductase RutF/quercetin dioxygenase-like cupin family protein